MLALRTDIHNLALLQITRNHVKSRNIMLLDHVAPTKFHAGWVYAHTPTCLYGILQRVEALHVSTH